MANLEAAKLKTIDNCNCLEDNYLNKWSELDYAGWGGSINQATG
jgi:hypothetical protein